VGGEGVVKKIPIVSRKTPNAVPQQPVL